MDSVARHRTAIRRVGLSRPLRVALEDGVISSQTTVFDYGCGHGDDLRYLESAGITSFGWDPAFRVEGVKQAAEVVQLGYVVNVIEDPSERAEVLRSAWQFARGALVVSGRLTAEGENLPSSEYSDGHLTRLGTFQKFYDQQELRSWIDGVLGESSVAAAPGVFYVFRDPGAREAFLASRYRRPAGVPRQRRSDKLFDEHQSLFDPLMAFVNDRGRLPDAWEIPAAEELTVRFGSIRRAFAIVRRVTGREHWEQVKSDRAQDFLVYLALGRFGRRPKISALPRDLQLDIKEFFGTYNRACADADRLLFSAGNMTAIDEACCAVPFGKLLPTAFYVHVTGLAMLPPILRVYEGCARVLSGTVEGTTLIKFHRQQPKVSYLVYPTFDESAHPCLSTSLRVHLQTRQLRFRDFRDAENPPILHRKETFVPADYPRREEFACLTEQEEARGLLLDTANIGTKKGWETVLAAQRVQTRDHTLIEPSET